ncbi:MAG TPA: AtpZ/AtpI family protein [Gemmatimonadaceae bacterium]|nr:AtpZ/AtpI family protein [Gemmatimonadaceae bacterium]
MIELVYHLVRPLSQQRILCLRFFSQSPRFPRGMDAGERSREQGSREARRGPLGSLAQYAAAGFEFAASVLLGLLAGQWLDKKLGTAPLFLLIGVLLGMAAGFWNLYRLSAKLQQRSPSQDGE